MLKKLGFSAIALAAVLVFAGASPAAAKVRFGVTIGTPGYAYPVDPYATPYVDPYAYGYADPYYAPAPSYVYPAPTYVAPYSYGFSYGNRWGGHDRHEWREHERHEFREHGGREGHGRR